MQTNILEYLETTAGRVPDKFALCGEGEQMSFFALKTAAQQIGSCLLNHGADHAPVAVLMPKRPQTIAAFLGAVYAGCYYVPLDPQMPQRRMDMILQKLEPGFLICDESTYALAQALNFCGPIIPYHNAVACAIDTAGLSGVRERQIDIDPLYIVFTSGSTGEPKGVVGCHRAVIDYIEAFCEVMGFDETTVFGNQTPLYFDAYLKEIIPTLKYGATTHLIPKRLFVSPLRLVEYLNEQKINTLCWVVSALTMISSFRTFEKAKPKYVRTVAFASEVFPIRQLNIWRQALPNARFLNLYGPTETTGICCYYEVRRSFCEDEPLPIGRPFRNTQIILLDENNRPGKQGEICIRGTRLTPGYYKDEAKTKACFTQNPIHTLYWETVYRTGDMGRLNDDGELIFLGRKDHQIKHMGHRIELGEIEAAAVAREGVFLACCTYSANHLWLYFTGAPSCGELTAWLKERLPRYMLPHRIIRLETMPTTPNGKIDRNFLKQRSNTDG